MITSFPFRHSTKEIPREAVKVGCGFFYAQRTLLAFLLTGYGGFQASKDTRISTAEALLDARVNLDQESIPVRNRSKITPL